MNRVELVKKINELGDNINANVKFLSLFYSRLREDGIGGDDAELIASSINFDFSNIPEDDDTLSDIATAYSTYCCKIHKKLNVFGHGKNIKRFKPLFSQIRLEVDR